MADPKVLLTNDLADMGISVGHTIDSVASDISNNEEIEYGSAPVQLAWQMNSCFIDSLIMCLVSSDPFCEAVLKSFGKMDEILNDHAFYHMSFVIQDMENGGVIVMQMNQ